MRLIDAETFAERLQRDPMFPLLDYCNILGVLGAEPTVDAVPVRHGRWIHDGYDNPHGVDWMHCSECGSRDVFCPAAMTSFCPNCGARMDADTEKNVEKEKACSNCQEFDCYGCKWAERREE